MSLKPLSPQAARQQLDRGAVLVDIRSDDEHAREHIAQALHVPAERLHDGSAAFQDAKRVIFYCRSGARTQAQAQALSACRSGDAYMLEGGLDAWKKAGLPVVIDASRPIELQRQVQIVAGSLVVLGTVLGATASAWFLALSGFVGAGLVFAGVSGFCGLARVLMAMPWNRRTL